MKLQILIELDEETGKCTVASNAPTPPQTYGAMVAGFEALMFRNIMAALNSSGIVRPTDEEVSALQHGTQPGT